MSFNKQGPGKDPDDTLTADNPWVEFLAPPLALLLAYVSHWLVIPAVIFDAFRIWLHEFGHAFVGWFGSRAATPLGMGWTNIEMDRSWYVWGCFLFLLGVLAVKGWRARTPFLVALALLMFALQCRFTFFTSAGVWEQAMRWGGIGGEFYLSAILIASFHYRLPARLRWDLWRFLALAVGVYVFREASLQWLAIERGDELLPFGTMIHGEEDQNGDLNQLLDNFGWSRKDLIRTYVRVGFNLKLAVIGHWLLQGLWSLAAKQVGRR